MLAEDEEWLHEISIHMDPKEGCLWVLGVGDDGIECLKQVIIEERASAAERNPDGDP